MAMAWIWTGMAAVSLIFAAWNGTMDAVGAAVGICCLCRKKGKKAKIVLDLEQNAAGKLLDVFLRFARANHLAFLTLEVRPSNAAAIALYTRFGFREAGRRRNYYDLPKEDALILTRTFEEDDQ